MKRILVMTFVLAFTAGCSSSGPIQTGGNSFMISKQSATGYQSAVGIKAEVMREAAEHCAESGKYFVAKNIRSKDGVPGVSYATVDMTYGCYTENDPKYVEAQLERGPDSIDEVRIR